MKHLVFFSGGLGSFATTHRILNDGTTTKDDLELIFTDTQIEDKTLYQFILESCKAFFGGDIDDLLKEIDELTNVEVDIAKRKQELIEISHKAMEIFPNLHWLRYEVKENPISPWDIFFNTRFIGNSRVAQCSNILKQRMSRDYIRDYFNPEEIKLYLGIDWTESHRRTAPIRNWKKYAVSTNFPLCEEPYITKDDKLSLLDYYGIKLPKLYEDQFAHNNCGGFCVRAGQKHFKNLLITNPELFEYHAKQERNLSEIIREIKKTEEEYSILKETKNGVVYSLSLDALKERMINGGVIDEYDWGGCGCFVTDDIIDDEDDDLGNEDHDEECDYYDEERWGMRDLVLMKGYKNLKLK